MANEARTPTVLAIDTSGPVAGCAVLAGGRIAHLAAMNHGLTHSEIIMPAVDEARSAAGLRGGAGAGFAGAGRARPPSACRTVSPGTGTPSPTKPSRRSCGSMERKS